MVAKIRQSSANSPSPKKPVVGEIDTSPPFQSVKDAVSLFGEGAVSSEKPVIKKAKPYFAQVTMILFFSIFLFLGGTNYEYHIVTVKLYLKLNI